MGRLRIGLISGRAGYVAGGLMKIRFRRRTQDRQRTADWSLVLTKLYIHTPVCGKEEKHGTANIRKKKIYPFARKDNQCDQCDLLL